MIAVAIFCVKCGKVMYKGTGHEAGDRLRAVVMEKHMKETAGLNDTMCGDCRAIRVRAEVVGRKEVV